MSAPTPLVWTARLVLGLAALAALAPVGSLAGAAPARSPSGAAGASSCRACHARAFESWEGSAHALTLRAASADALPPEVAAGATVEHAPGSTSFRRDGSRFLATTTGPDGKPGDWPIAWVVGYRRLRMLVADLPDGRLQVLPAMREEPSGRWFDYTHLLFAGPETDPATAPTVRPGDDSFWTGPTRSFDGRCVRCHASGAEPREPGPSGNGARTAWRAPAVDCEACHGPGAEHNRFWEALPRDPSKDPLRGAARVDRERSIGACLSCHLEGEPVVAGTGAGTDPFEAFVPTLLDDTVRVDASGRPLELVYEGLSFSTSACAEEGGLTCLSCHDAHGTRHGAQLRAPSDGYGLCVGCHRAVASDVEGHSHHRAGREGAQCVACHMPLVTIERGHGAVRDHAIGIPRPPREGTREATDACTWCHAALRGAPPGAPPLTTEEIRSSYESWWPARAPRPAWTAAIERARAGDPEALPGLEAVLASASTPRVVRGSAARLLRNYPEAALDRAVALLSDDDVLVRAGAAAALGSVRGERADAALLLALSDRAAPVRREAARAALSGFERARKNRALALAALPVLEADAAAATDDDQRWFLVGAARQLAGDRRGAVAAYERQLALDPYAAHVREHLEELRRQAETGPR